MTYVTCRLTAITGISSGTLRSVIEYGLPVCLLFIACTKFIIEKIAANFVASRDCVVRAQTLSLITITPLYSHYTGQLALVKNWSILFVTVLLPACTADSALGLGRRHWSSPQQCYLYGLRTFH